MEATRTLGKYTLMRHLATGGMAEIWLAEQVGPGGFAKELVIKQILPHLARDDEFTTMFLDEARLAAQLSHPKIAQIYELGETDGQYFIAMEFIDGIDLTDLITLANEKGQAVPFNIAAKVMMDMLEALDYAHDFTTRDGLPLNLVHRDVTPHNVIVSNDGIVKLVDFGVAKAKANQSKTQTGAVKGKYAYMAPEQIQNSGLDRRADLFAAGVVLYELITTEKPFGEQLEAVSNILTKDAPDPRSVRPETPAELAAVVAKAMAKDPEQRYQDAHEMLRDIEAWLRTNGEYVGDRQLSAWIRDLQGLPNVRHTGVISERPSSAPERITPAPQPVNTPAPQPIAEPRFATPVEGTDPAIPIETEAAFAPTGAHEGVGTGPTGELPPGPTTGSMEPAGSSNKTLIFAFVALTIAILAAGGGVFYFAVMQGDNGEEKAKVEPKTDEKKAAKTVIPPEFLHPDGELVSISSREPVTVYYKGKRIGTTPFQTSLRAGAYDIEIEVDGKRKQTAFKVEEGSFHQTISLKP